MARISADLFSSDLPRKALAETVMRRVCVKSEGAAPSGVSAFEFSKRCVPSVPSSVALRRRGTAPSRCTISYPTPRSALAGALSHLKRAARRKRFLRICERLAPLAPHENEWEIGVKRLRRVRFGSRACVR